MVVHFLPAVYIKRNSLSDALVSWRVRYIPQSGSDTEGTGSVTVDCYTCTFYMEAFLTVIGCGGCRSSRRLYTEDTDRFGNTRHG